MAGPTLIDPVNPRRLDAAIRRAVEAARGGPPDDEDGSFRATTLGGDSGPVSVPSTQ